MHTYWTCWLWKIIVCIALARYIVEDLLYSIPTYNRTTLFRGCQDRHLVLHNIPRAPRTVHATRFWITSQRCDSSKLTTLTQLHSYVVLSTNQKSCPEGRDSASERGLGENDERDDDYGKGNEDLKESSQRLQRQAVSLVVQSHAHLLPQQCCKGSKKS